MDVETFDYIIVGAGSAGCVLADRLTEDGRSSVLVLEYGGSDRSVFIQMPAALSIPMNSKTYNWGYWSEPERIWAAGASPVRAARFSAARARSMAWSMCAGIRSISSAGRRKAPRAGAIATCCPTSAARRAFKAAQTPIAATPGRWRRRMDPWVATSRLRRFIAGVGGRRTHAIPHRHVEGSKPLLPLAVEVGADRIAACRPASMKAS
jgi:GMC oxidoreductase